MPEPDKPVQDDDHTLEAKSLLQDAEPSPAIVKCVQAAIHAPGYLVLTGLFDEHPADLVALTQMQHFFALPDAGICKQSVNVQQRTVKHGWMPLYGEPAYEAGTRARVESFDCGSPRNGHANNQWPDIPGFRVATTALWDRFTTAGAALLKHIALAAGMPVNFLSDRCASQALSTMRLLHYPGFGESEPSVCDNGRDVGLSAHSDFECITLLYQTTAGLELRDTRGDWRDAPVGERQVIILFGDMLETWTNGLIKATGHRVRRTGQPRYSMVLFFAVNDDVTVQPLPQFSDRKTRLRYPAVTQREHSRQRLSQAEKNRDAERLESG